MQLRWEQAPPSKTQASGDGDLQDLGIFLGTPIGLVQPLLEAAGLNPGESLVDLGCGDGRVLIEAARLMGVHGVGYESDPQLVEQARAHVADAGVSELVEIVHADARTAPLGDADVVFAFLPPEAVAELLPASLSAMAPGARFISHEQIGRTAHPIPDQTRLILSPSGCDLHQAGITVADIWVVSNFHLG